MVDKNGKKISYNKLQDKCEEYLSGWKRAQADYHNLEKEMANKRQEWVKMANADILIQLLPVYDNLKLALKHAGKRSDWVIGVEHVANQFRKVLEENGVEEIETVGQEFDPEIHEAFKSHNTDRKSTRLNSSHTDISRMPSSA